MDFRHLIVTCLFSKLRLPFDNQKVKENYAILYRKIQDFCIDKDNHRIIMALVDEIQFAYLDLQQLI